MNIPIVVLTTSANPATREELLELGATDFITKPDKFSDWENLIGQVVANLNSKNGGHS